MYLRIFLHFTKVFPLCKTVNFLIVATCNLTGFDTLYGCVVFRLLYIYYMPVQNLCEMNSIIFRFLPVYSILLAMNNQ